MDNIIKGILAAALSVVTYLFGGIDGLVTALVTVITLDYMTGVLAAAHGDRLNSQTGAKGIMKKIMYMAVVALANIIDGVVDTGGMLRDASIYFFIANEGLSILENAASMGFPLPSGFVEKLEQLKGR